MIYGVPIGLLGAGELIGRIGFVATANLYVAASLVVTAFIAIKWRGDLWRIDAPANAR